MQTSRRKTGLTKALPIESLGFEARHLSQIRLVSFRPTPQHPHGFESCLLAHALKPLQTPADSICVPKLAAWLLAKVEGDPRRLVMDVSKLLQPLRMPLRDPGSFSGVVIEGV